MTGPGSSVAESAAASHSLGIVQVVGALLHGVEDRLVDRSRVAVRSRSSSLESIAFIGAIVGVGAVGEGAGLLVGLGLDLLGNVLVDVNAGLATKNDSCARTDDCSNRHDDIDFLPFVDAAGVEKGRVVHQGVGNHGQR